MSSVVAHIETTKRMMTIVIRRGVPMERPVEIADDSTIARWATQRVAHGSNR
jgi:hypothetical protein